MKTSGRANEYKAAQTSASGSKRSAEERLIFKEAAPRIHLDAAVNQTAGHTRRQQVLLDTVQRNNKVSFFSPCIILVPWASSDEDDL